ncbi:filamentous hemagglutinin N-terminal domain-containing protein [Paraburkholderia dilworthii]|uniref:Filamentous hemagglutinin N-terminal domain-containing protein n=1 Tax=Paraburkholderia dilworthii TaxID=948106 RepID=A0ABW9DBY2_9BURK
MKQYRLHMISVAALAALGATGSAMAGGIVATGGQTQVSTPGNTPIVNIAGANAAGISRNTFSNFDVDKNGVVFNNLTAAGVSQLAGQLAANANLNGTAAKVIVADVNSVQASQLNGAMEVAGAPAHLMIANAAGISVNGATTINAPVLTLAAANFNPTAASPLGVMVDTNRATPSAIEINGAGLDVGAGQLNLLSRATIVNAAVKGWSINSQNGTQFDGDANGNFTGKLTSNAAGAKPAVALDVSALGGMYANKIVLEGSEHGLGVNNAGVIQAGNGGYAVQMYGADIQGQPGGILASQGSSYTVRAADMAATPDMWRPEQYRGLDEAQIFQLEKQEFKAAADKSNAYNQRFAEDPAKLSDSDKIAQVGGLYEQIQLMRAQQNPDTDPDVIARKAADAAQQAEIARQNAARAAEQAAEQQAAAQAAQQEAQLEAAREADYQAMIAARQAEAKARWEADQAAQSANTADAQQQAAAQQAAFEQQKAADIARQQAEQQVAAQIAQQDAQREAAREADYQAMIAARLAEAKARWEAENAQSAAQATQQISYAPQAQPVTLTARYAE